VATRHNTCINPCLSVDNANWGGNGTAPVRTAVTGFGRGFAARYSDGTFVRTAYGAAAPASTYTVSVSLRFPAFGVSGHIYIEWQNASHGALSYTSADYSTTAGAVTRISVTGVAPASTAFIAAIIDGESFSGNNLDVTMVLVEQTADLDTYLDGDTPGASWDGLAGASASTYVDTVTGTGAFTSPPTDFAGAATLTNAASGAAALPPSVLAGTAAAIATATGEITTATPSLAGTGSAKVTATGAFTMPAPVVGSTPTNLSALGAVLLSSELGGTLLDVDAAGQQA
jgi:hypothetical protein